MRARLFVVSMVTLAAAGCGWRKQHLNRTHGQSYEAVFTAQRERVGKQPAEAASGLDAQEAAIISDGYRRGLAPKEGGGAKESIIMLAPPSASQPYTPPPSVPRE